MFLTIPACSCARRNVVLKVLTKCHIRSDDEHVSPGEESPTAAPQPQEVGLCGDSGGFEHEHLLAALEWAEPAVHSCLHVC